MREVHLRAMGCLLMLLSIPLGVAAQTFKCSLDPKKATPQMPPCPGSLLGPEVAAPSVVPNQRAPAEKNPKSTGVMPRQGSLTNPYGQATSVDVGAFNWVVYRAFSSARIEKAFEPPTTGDYLFVDLSVQNISDSPQAIPVPILIDETGASYLPTPDALVLREAIPIGDRINPTQSILGVVIYRAPPNKQYVLKVTGRGGTAMSHIKLDLKEKPYGRRTF